MPTAQIELIEEELYDYETDTKTRKKLLYISGTMLRKGDTVEILTPKGWLKATISITPHGEWRFYENSLKPVGLIARTL